MRSCKAIGASALAVGSALTGIGVHGSDAGLGQRHGRTTKDNHCAANRGAPTFRQISRPFSVTCLPYCLTLALDFTLTIQPCLLSSWCWWIKCQRSRTTSRRIMVIRCRFWYGPLQSLFEGCHKGAKQNDRKARL